MDNELVFLERIALSPKESVDLGYTGQKLHKLKELATSTESACSDLEHQAKKLLKSSKLDIQLQGAGLSKVAATQREKLPALAKRASAVEQKLKRLLE